MNNNDEDDNMGNDNKKNDDIGDIDKFLIMILKLWYWGR